MPPLSPVPPLELLELELELLLVLDFLTGAGAGVTALVGVTGAGVTVTGAGFAAELGVLGAMDPAVADVEPELWVTELAPEDEEVEPAVEAAVLAGAFFFRPGSATTALTPVTRAW